MAGHICKGGHDFDQRCSQDKVFEGYATTDKGSEEGEKEGRVEGYLQKGKEIIIKHLPVSYLLSPFDRQRKSISTLSIFRS